MRLPSSFRLSSITLPLLTLPLLLSVSCGDDGGSGVTVEDYVRSDVYSAMVFEVDRVPEVTPNASALSSLRATAESVLDKPGGITVVEDDVLESAGPSPVWSTSDLRALSDASHDLDVDANTVVMHVLYLNGTWEGSDTVIGLQFRRNAVAIFAERIAQACQGVLPLFEAQLCRGLETTVITHEFGHAIGLVDNGLAMVNPHEDAEHPAHDPDPDCLMYWAAEGSDVVGALGSNIMGGGSEALSFCPDSLADIAALRDL